MSFPKGLRKMVMKKLDDGDYVLHGDDLTITLNPRAASKKYIYKTEDGYRVLVPHAEDPSKKESLGYYDTEEEARKVRDEWLSKENALHGVKKAQKAANKAK